MAVQTDEDVMYAVRDIILDLTQRFIPYDITPRSAYTDVAPGDLTVALTDLSGFAPGGSLEFIDDTGEEMLWIKDDWDGSNPVPINWDGMEYTGFQFAHSGGVASTALIVDVPDKIGPMLSTQNPVIFITIIEEQDALPGGLLHEPVYEFWVEYRLSLQRPQTSLMNVNRWSLKQQKRARKDFANVANAIRRNPKLQTESGNHATDLHNPFNPNEPRVRIRWQKKVVSTPESDIAQFVCALSFPVRGLRVGMSPLP